MFNLRIALGAPLAVGLLCTMAGASAAVDTETDWQQRRTAQGVIYSEGFEFATKADLLAASDGHTDNPPQNEIDLDTAVKLSGAKALKLVTHAAAAGNGGSWGQHLDGSVGNKFTTFYFQFAIYLPRDTLAYRWKGGDGQLKLVNLEQYGAAQVVVTNRKFLGFPTILMNGSGTLERNVPESVVPNVSSEYVYQPAVSDGNTSTPSTACQFWEKFGPARGISVNNDYGDSNPEPYLDRRGFAEGWPNRCALASGVPFELNGWTVVEVFVDYNAADPTQSTIKAWAAPYGAAPRMFINEVNTAQLHSNTDVYRRFELLNYDTPRLAEPGRPTLYTYFDEVVVSTEPIKFPGGFSLPNGATIRPRPPTSVRAE